MTAETKEKARGESMAALEKAETRDTTTATLSKAETRDKTTATLSKAETRDKTMGDSSEVKTRGKTVETEPGRILVCSDEADMRSYVVQSEDVGVRVDVLLSRVFGDLSRSRVQQMLTEGGVTLLTPDGDTRAGSKYGPCIVSKSYKVKDGDRLSLEVYDLVPIDAAPEDIPIDIVYEDEDLVVVDKPQGMVVHP
ncbi:MAG: hypothetical protein LBK04_04455, partial [Clostridiales Family XIII bacterium]|nr:hypothetical protein [Clostridiales Family XIII bacterium]